MASTNKIVSVEVPIVPVEVPAVQAGSNETVAPVMRTQPMPISQFEKPEKFKGANFKRWQQKMMFFLTTLNLIRFLKEDVPEEDKNDAQSVAAIEAWKSGDYLCRNYILNSLDDALFNVYSPKETAKNLWESLEKKYKVDDAGTKKFVAGRFHDYKMVDGKSVVEQCEEL